VLAELRSREHPTRCSHHTLQQRKFSPGEIDAPIASAGDSRRNVKGKVPYPVTHQGFSGLPPDQRTQTSGELLDRERLGQVIVRTQIESLDFITDLASRGQNENWNRIRLLPQRAKDAKAIAAGKHDVQDNGIKTVVEDNFQSLVSAMDDVDPD
jgi:hypothetical protein